MKWTYYQGEWEAVSGRKFDDGQQMCWRITVLEDGTFTTSETDEELEAKSYTCPTFQQAKAACEAMEAGREVQSPIIIDEPHKPPGTLTDVVSAWFGKTLGTYGTCTNVDIGPVMPIMSSTDTTDKPE